MKSFLVAPLNVKLATTVLVESGESEEVAAAVNSIIDISKGFDTCDDDRTVHPWLQQFIDSSKPGDLQQILRGARCVGYVVRVQKISDDTNVEAV